ncbi:NUDIX domain-containing protein [Brachybacterium squillarum]|uniref:NUDIX domain-containing protein n=1 Tax=Brachybacterium squillarum TaxID=661979 RepID=UPI0002629E82|nr:NUDIX domain-containing protein [Brachybacterium squillarum]
MTSTGTRPRPPRRIVLVAGPSGSGKGEMSRRSGLPALALDEFYRELDDPGLPRRFGIVDWDDPASWDAGAALEALTALAHDGVAQVPTYSISASRRTGSAVMDVGEAPLIVAEGIFAAELIAPLAAMGLLADAVVLRRPTALVFSLRLARDLREHRKPPLTLLRRGWALAREQRGDVEAWRRAGMRPVGLHGGVDCLRGHTALAEAESHHRAEARTPQVLRIAAVAVLREGERGTELLTVRKRATGTWMQVGGKLEPGEEARAAAVREVAEELDVRLDPAELEDLGEVRVAAANEPDTLVHASLFLSRAAMPADLRARAEIADLRWFPLHEDATGVRIAPLMRDHLLPLLRAR